MGATITSGIGWFTSDSPAVEPPARQVRAAAPGAEPGRARKFDSTHHFVVFQLQGRSPRMLGMTPTPNKAGIQIPAGAEWFVAPLPGFAALARGKPAGGLGGGLGALGGMPAQGGAIIGGGGGFAGGFGGGAFGLGGGFGGFGGG